eukprot:3055920-Ditylum_brightwellii.AAC.1
MDIPRRTPMALHVGWLMMFVVNETCGVRKGVVINVLGGVSVGVGLYFACDAVLFAFFRCVAFSSPLGFRFSGGDDVMGDERVGDLQGWGVLFQCFVEDSLGVFRF